MNGSVPVTNLPLIVKFSSSQRNGIQTVNLTRHAVGYIVQGKKQIHYGDLCYEIGQGELFYLGRGVHYFEDIPDDGKEFKQILFYYSSDVLRKIIEILSTSYGMVIINDPAAAAVKPEPALHANMPAWGAAKHFFAATAMLLKNYSFPGYRTIERLLMTQLICLLVSQENCNITSRLLDSVNTDLESFEKLVEKHIFDKITLNEMALRCGMSLSAFKRAFKNNYQESPHIWIRRRRIMQGRVLLLSTNRTISDIASECRFRNASHFIKIFREEFGQTPAAYKAVILQQAEIYTEE